MTVKGRLGMVAIAVGAIWTIAVAPVFPEDAKAAGPEQPIANEARDRCRSHAVESCKSKPDDERDDCAARQEERCLQMVLRALRDPGRPVSSDSEAEEAFGISAFVGQVLNSFSAQSNLDYLNDDGDDRQSDSGIVAGLALDLDLYERNRGVHERDTHWKHGLSLEMEVVHSSRVFETPCDPSGAADPNNPTEEECEAQSESPSQPANADFFKIVKDSSTLEGIFALKYTPIMFGPGPESWQWGLYMKAQGGLIRSSTGGDDFIDNHFAGMGIERLNGAFANSSVELGTGKTDLFAPGHRSDRFKFAVRFYYAPKEGVKKREQARLEAEADAIERGKTSLDAKDKELQQRLASTDDAVKKQAELDQAVNQADRARLEAKKELLAQEREKAEEMDSYVNFFAEMFWDADRRDGSDDIQLYYGISFDVDNIFDKLAGR